MDVAASLGNAFEYALGRTFDRLVGLTDDEWAWEPAPGAWSVRLREDGLWTPDLGGDGTQWVPDPAPVSTISWRLFHLGADKDAGRTMAGLDLSSGPALIARWFDFARQAGPESGCSADESVALLKASWAPVPDGIRALGDGEDGLAAVIPFGPYAGSTAFDLLQHVLDELVHHAAEVGVLRDLWRAVDRGPARSS